MNKNGFTLVELLGVIVVLAIVFGLAVVGVSHVINTGKQSIYFSLEKTMESSSKNYIIDNYNEIISANFPINISLNKLIEKGYIDKYKLPDEGNCDKSYVRVSKSSELSYKTCLICKNGDNILYKTSDDCDECDDC